MSDEDIIRNAYANQLTNLFAILFQGEIAGLDYSTRGGFRYSTEPFHAKPDMALAHFEAGLTKLRAARDAALAAVKK